MNPEQGAEWPVIEYQPPTTEQIRSLLDLAGDNFREGPVPETLWHLSAEVLRHRADARARGEIPPLGPTSPTIGEMHDALMDVVSRGVEATLSRVLMEQVIREVLHLRGQLTRAQDLATRERDMRVEAQERENKARIEADMIREMMLERRQNSLPVERRSLRWIEAAKRIEEAVDKGRDANPEDMRIVLEEKTKLAK